LTRSASWLILIESFMSEPIVTMVICVVVGLVLVCFPRPIAKWFCRRMKDLWELHDDDLFAKGCAGAVWVIERVSFGRVREEADAPKAVRFFGFLYIWVALMHLLDYVVL
jgi:hypothetical protein